MSFGAVPNLAEWRFMRALAERVVLLLCVGGLLISWIMIMTLGRLFVEF